MINSFKSELKKIAYGKDIVEKKYNREVYGWLSEALGNRLEDCLGKTDVDYIFERLRNYFKVMGKPGKPYRVLQKSGSIFICWET